MKIKLTQKQARRQDCKIDKKFTLHLNATVASKTKFRNIIDKYYKDSFRCLQVGLCLYNKALLIDT